MEDQVIINVSGRRFETRAATLRHLPHSLLGDEERRAAFWEAARGEFFFDRSASSFEGVLLAYQTGGDTQRSCNVPESVFIEDLRFYGLTEQAERLAGGERSEPPPPPPPGGWRGKASAVLRSPVVTAVSMLVTVVSVLAFIVATVPSLQSPEFWEEYDSIDHQLVLGRVELVCMVLLFVELVACFVSSSSPARFFRDPMNIVDLIATILFFVCFIVAATRTFGLGYMRVIPWLFILSRLVRLFRVFRFVRQTAAGAALRRTAATAAPSIAVIFAIWVAAVIFFASLVFWIEMEVEHTNITSIPESMYWAVITMTTVGYGDVIPYTLLGKVITGICAYTGCVLAALPVAVLVTKFSQCSEVSRPDRYGGGSKTWCSSS